VERTGPFGLTCLSLVTVWYALHGHSHDDALVHRARARWYTTKTEPSYDDMAIKLRRVIIAARFHNPWRRDLHRRRDVGWPRKPGDSGLGVGQVRGFALAAATKTVLEHPTLRSSAAEWQPHAAQTRRSTEWWYLTSLAFGNVGNPYFLF
jgi:hypothetical protein